MVRSMCSSNILSDSFFVVLGMYECECMFIDVKLFSIPPSISTPICLTTMVSTELKFQNYSFLDRYIVLLQLFFLGGGQHLFTTL